MARYPTLTRNKQRCKATFRGWMHYFFLRREMEVVVVAQLEKFDKLVVYLGNGYTSLGCKLVEYTYGPTEERTQKVCERVLCDWYKKEYEEDAQAEYRGGNRKTHFIYSIKPIK